ncbi:MAG: hypothetical protein PVJ39_07405 [Gammaproteobacteria bacterium]
MSLHKSTGQSIKDCKSIIEQMPENLRELYVTYYETNPKSWFIDPIELDPKYQEVIKEIDREVESHVMKEKDKRIKRQKEAGMEIMGFRGMCHFEWKIKKELLKEKHSITWKSPGEMNPNVVFD